MMEETVQYFLSYADRLRPMVIDAELVLNQALDAGKHVLMEGRPGHHARRGPRHLPLCDLL